MREGDERGSSLRTLLALRHVLFTSANESPTRNVVVHLARPSVQIEAASFRDARGRPLVAALDMSLFLNSLLFACAAQHGLSRVLMHLLDADGEAFQRRRAALFCGGVAGATVAEASRRLDGGAIIGGHRDVRVCPHPEDVIAPDDLVLFVAATSTPRAARRPPRELEAHETRAKDVFSEFAPQDEPPRVRQVLICGWRRVWADDAPRLQARIAQLLVGAAPGSSAAASATRFSIARRSVRGSSAATRPCSFARRSVRSPAGASSS